MKLPWSKTFSDTLPLWCSRNPNSAVLMTLSGLAVFPAAFGTYFSHFSMSDRDKKRVGILSTLNYCGCFLTAASAAPSGLQSAMFGLPARTLEFHPLFALKRFLLPCLPFGLNVLALRASADIPRLSVHYLLYSCLASIILDFMAALARTVPWWVFRLQAGTYISIFALLCILSTHEELGIDSLVSTIA